MTGTIVRAAMLVVNNPDATQLAKARELSILDPPHFGNHNRDIANAGDSTRELTAKPISVSIIAGFGDQGPNPGAAWTEAWSSLRLSRRSPH